MQGLGTSRRGEWKIAATHLAPKNRPPVLPRALGETKLVKDVKDDLLNGRE
jgi:hypothetical protein